MTRLRSFAVIAMCTVSPLLLGGLAPVQAQTAAEIVLRLDRMEGENRRLNGQVELLGNQVKRLEEQLSRFQKDVDFRFKDGGGSATPATTGRNTQKRSDAFDAGANPTAPGAPKTIGQLAAEASNMPDKSSGATASNDASPGMPAALTPGAGSKSSPSTAAAGTAKAAYDVANGMLERGEYEAAEMAFRDFLKSYGKDRLKAEAVFGLGESLYRRNRYREAAEQYLAVTTDHPKATRAAESMLKLGMALRGLGATPEACGTYAEVGKKYPRASPAIRAAVDREKKRAQCTS